MKNPKETIILDFTTPNQNRHMYNFLIFVKFLVIVFS